MEVTIERILPGGLGLAHVDGKTVMVTLAAPGDRLRVRVEREKANLCFASIAEIIEPSPDRVEPPCPYFGRCGGCNFQQMNYQAQLAAKVEIVRDCLHRITRIEDIPEFAIIPAPNEWHYRARAQWQYDADRKRLGYFESGSRRVCDVAECAVLVPELQRVLESLRDEMAQDSIAGGAQYFRAITGDEDASVATGFSRATPRLKARGQTARVGRPADPASQDQMKEISRTIAGETYRANAESFFQTNVELLPKLIELAIGAERGETALELYSGIGLFTLPLARRFRLVTAVEYDADAADFGKKNLRNAGLTNVTVERADVGNWLAWNQLNPKLASLDFILLDPPRTGAESRVIDGILRLKPKRICYVSCDPATLARDLRKLIAGGYSLDSIVAFDMFPQTHHVETIVNLIGP
ncbi:MAG TPA: class I SAM-dependent RNA methyltransferase [Pyrinomonadaceae bacterium]|nr:class I SAM-dependent RNA methyltransferase [Pyrinomonadaceae bacterium]